MTKQKPPDELRDYVDATTAWGRVALEYLESRDAGEAYGESDELMEGPFREAFAAMVEARGALSLELQRALRDAGC